MYYSEICLGETAKSHEKASVWLTRPTAYLDRYFMVEFSPSRQIPSWYIEFRHTTSFQIIKLHHSLIIVIFDAILSEILTMSYNTLHKKCVLYVNVIRSQILFDFITDCIGNVLFYGKQLLLTHHESTTECILLSCLTLQCA
jgi:hypothetical protein